MSKSTEVAVKLLRIQMLQKIAKVSVEEGFKNARSKPFFIFHQ